MGALRIFAAFVLFVLAASPAAAQKPDLTDLDTTFKKIVARARGRVGVGLIHLESGATLAIRGDERFPMASVVKLPIAIEVLTQVAERKLTLDRRVWLEASDIRPCCTLERRHPQGGASRTVGDLLELSMIGQLLLDMAGIVDAPPPGQWTIELQRRLVAEVDRVALNRGRAQYLTDERDTATPYETAQLLGRLQLADLLPASETELLLSLMTGSITGPRRLKGRLPEDTPVAHKTGTTAVVINDVGIITLPPHGKVGGRIALAVYVADGAGLAAMERTVAHLGAAAFEFFSGKSATPSMQFVRRKQRVQRRTN
jgi:beta-lactamase class A